MKIIPSILAFLVALGATYFSLEQKRTFDSVRDIRIENEDQNTKQTGILDGEKSALKAEVEKLNGSIARKSELEASIDALNADGNKLKSEAADLDDQIKQQDGEFAELDKVMQAINDQMQNLEGGVTLDELPAKIDEIKSSVKEKEARLDELTTLVESAKKAIANARSNQDRLVKRTLSRNANIARNSMSAVITAVNQGWGFVVIGAGANSGFTPQTTLIVQRDGRAIGRVKPSSIEPTQTVAEIDQDSLAEGVVLQPGDRVMTLKPNAN